MKMYRIFEDKNGHPCTLFHGVNGSRQLPLDTWIESENKLVTDGSCSTLYLSGFHLLESFEDIVKFLSKFRKLDNRVICAVDVDENSGIWDKKHSKASVKLVKRMMIPKEYWNDRVSANKLRKDKV